MVPLLGPFDDRAPLALDLLARRLVDARFLHEQLFENFADLEPDRIAVFDEVDRVRSATASVTTWASLLTLSRSIARTVFPLTAQNRTALYFLTSSRLHFAEHFLIICAALLHLVGISLENDAHFVVDAVFQRKLFQQSGMDLFREGRRRLGLDETARYQFFGNFAGQIAHIFFGKEHGESAICEQKV